MSTLDGPDLFHKKRLESEELICPRKGIVIAREEAVHIVALDQDELTVTSLPFMDFLLVDFQLGLQ